MFAQGRLERYTWLFCHGLVGLASRGSVFVVIVQPSLSGRSVCCDSFTFSGDLPASPGSKLSWRRLRPRSCVLTTQARKTRLWGSPGRGHVGMRMPVEVGGGLHVGKGWKKEGGVTYVLCFPSLLLSVSAEGIILVSSSCPQWALHRAWPTADAQEIFSKD